MENKSIYHIQNDHLQLMHLIETNEGEITPEIDSQLSLTKEQFEDKATSYGFLMKSLNDDVTIIKQEIDRLSKIVSAKNKLEDELKHRLVFAMETFGIDKVSKNNLTLSFRKSNQTIVSPEAEIPKKYITTEISETVNKTLLKSDIQHGIVIPGVEVKEINNLQIK